MAALEADRNREDDSGQNGGESRKPERTESRGHTDRGRHPDGRGGRQTVHLAAVRQLQDPARAQKADSRDDDLHE